MKATLLIDERQVLDSEAFVEIVVWRLPRPARGSRHPFKYRLALVVDGAAFCVTITRRAKETIGTYSTEKNAMTSPIPMRCSPTSGATLKK
jgi:hypothetical protein